MDISNIVEQMESTADWRRGKAEEFPDDKRNLEAAEELEKLAGEIRELGNSDMSRRIEELWAAVLKNNIVPYRTYEWFDEKLRAFGFRTYYKNGAEFLEEYCEKLEEGIRWETDSGDDTDDGVPSPDLAQQVENDETVKAARLAYEEARAKAYAEARKRL